jgi:transposase-like protein
MKEKDSKGGKPPLFPEPFKIAVAREYLLGQLSYSQLAKKHQLTSGDTVRYFVSWYKQWIARQEQEAAIEPGAAVDNALALTDQLKQANLRITALEMLIKNAEKELGVDLVKKSGTKQQGK